MSTYLIQAIGPAELATVRAEGVDRQHHSVTAFVDELGGNQLRCCLRRSDVGERIMLISHTPLQTDSPWREVGPVFVHAEHCSGWADSPDVPEWFDDAPRVLRAYTTHGGMHYPANRVVGPGEGVGAALAEMFRDPAVAEVHIRNLLAQCFIARAGRQP